MAVEGALRDNSPAAADNSSAFRDNSSKIPKSILWESDLAHGVFCLTLHSSATIYMAILIDVLLLPNRNRHQTILSNQSASVSFVHAFHACNTR